MACNSHRLARLHKVCHLHLHIHPSLLISPMVHLKFIRTHIFRLGKGFLVAALIQPHCIRQNSGAVQPQGDSGVSRWVSMMGHTVHLHSELNTDVLRPLADNGRCRYQCNHRHNIFHNLEWNGELTHIVEQCIKSRFLACRLP